MKKFIVLYYAPASAQSKMDEMNASDPEATKKGMEAWMAWAEKTGENLVDLGTPLGKGVSVTESGSSPSEKGVVGYSVLQAEDRAAAEALLAGHPHLGWAEGCEIELHESLPLPS